MTELLRPQVRTPYGPVAGIRRTSEHENRYDAFLGIPFAAPPVGRMRLAAPQPPVGWAEVRDASSYGPTPQRRPFADVTAIPEPTLPGTDTLNVNVFTPALSDRERPSAGLPVLVWIHGGGYKAGSPASPWYDGAAFARDGVVSVVVSYRLGFDGFASVPGAPENRGLLDQIAALAWVRDAISAFGGDPRRVTIAGQSAGGGSVLALLSSPRAEGLFHGAISQSGATRLTSVHDARAITSRFAEITGATLSVESLSALAPETIDDAQAALEAEAAARSVADPQGWVDRALDGRCLPGLVFLPVADEDVLPAGLDPVHVQSGLPLLAGATADEFSRIGPRLADMLRGAAPDELLRGSRLAPIAEEYLAERTASLHAGSVLGDLLTDVTFRLPVARIARDRQGPTWVYDMRYAPVGGLSVHCIDVPFVFDVLHRPEVSQLAGPTPPQQLADVMHGAWVQFIRTGTAPWATASGGVGMRFGGRDAAGTSAEGALYAVERRMLSAAGR